MDTAGNAMILPELHISLPDELDDYEEVSDPDWSIVATDLYDDDRSDPSDEEGNKPEFSRASVQRSKDELAWFSDASSPDLLTGTSSSPDAPTSPLGPFLPYSAEPSSRPADGLRVPLEILERIIQYALHPPGELTPASIPPAPFNRATFLLVSRGIRDIALPLVYHTIWTTKPSDYVAFFDPKSGLLVAGEGAKTRWRLVKQLAICTPVVPPTIDGRLASLIVPQMGHKLDKLCLLHPHAVYEDQRIEPFRRAQPTGQGHHVPTHLHHHPSPQRQQLKRPKPPKGTPPPPPLASKVVHAERQRFLSQLLGSVRPRELLLSSGALLCLDFARPGRIFDGAQAVVYAAPSLSPSHDDAFYRAFDTQSTLGAGPLVMRGFDERAWEAFEKWVRNGKSIPHGPGGTANVKKVKRWVFEMDCGERRQTD